MAGSKRKRLRKDTDEAQAAVVVTSSSVSLFSSTHPLDHSTSITTTSTSIFGSLSGSVAKRSSTTSALSTQYPKQPTNHASDHHATGSYSERKSVAFDRTALRLSPHIASHADHSPSSDLTVATQAPSAFSQHRSSTNRSRRRQRSLSQSDSADTSKLVGSKIAHISSHDRSSLRGSRADSRHLSSRRSRRKRRTGRSRVRTDPYVVNTSVTTETDCSERSQIPFATGASASKKRRRERQRSVVTPASHESGLLLFEPSLNQKTSGSLGPQSAERVVETVSASTSGTASGASGMRVRHANSRSDPNSSSPRDLSLIAGSPIPTVYLLPSSVTPLAVTSSSNTSTTMASTLDMDADDDRALRYVTVPPYSNVSSSLTHRDHSLAACERSPVDLSMNPAHHGSTRSMSFASHVVLHGAPMNEDRSGGAVISHTSFVPNTPYQSLHDANLVSTLLSQASFSQPVTTVFGYAVASTGSSGLVSQTGQQNAVNLTPMFSHPRLTQQGQPPNSQSNIGNMDTMEDSVPHVAGAPVAHHHPPQHHHPQLLNPISVARLISLNQPIPAVWSRSGKSGMVDVVGSSSYPTSIHFNPRSVHPQSHSHSQLMPAISTSHPQSLPSNIGINSHHYYYPTSGSSRAAARHAIATSSMMDSHTNNRMAHQSRGSVNPGRHSPHASGINHRIAQLNLNQTDRSLQLILLQDINQILLMGFEETLVNLNVQNLVRAVLEILECEDETLIELKTLGCNVLTHMIDTLPRSSDAVVPALPLLLTTMTSSFVGDILERMINLLEQLSRRHGREVLKSGAISAVLGFYDFVTLAQHRTILTMIFNCFVSLQLGDFALIADSLPSLAERLKESEPRCVERVCACFARLVLAYRAEPEILRRIVSSCNLFANLQHLLMASPPILSGIRDVVHMLAILCSSCPYLAVDLIKQNISSTLHCILTGEAVNSDALQSTLTTPIPIHMLLTLTSSTMNSSTTKRCRSRSGSGSQRKRSSSGPRTPVVGSNSVLVNHNVTGFWPPLFLTYSPLSEASQTISDLAIHQRSQDDVHGVVQLICELLPPVPASSVTYRPIDSQAPFPLCPSSPSASSVLYSDCGSMISLSTTSSYSSTVAPSGVLPNNGEQGCNRIINTHPGSRGSRSQRSESDRSETFRRSQVTAAGGTTGTSRSLRHLETVGHQGHASNSHNSHGRVKMMSTAAPAISCSSVSSTSSETLHQICLCLPHVTLSVASEDPRASLLYRECEALHMHLQHQSPLNTASEDRDLSTSSMNSSTKRRSTGRHRSVEDHSIPTDLTTGSGSPLELNREHAVGWNQEETQALQLVQTLLPLLFELFTETTKMQTRLRCLEAIQRMLFYSSPLLLAKVLRPRHVCSHIVGMLNSPEKRILLAGLHIASMLVDRIPPMFATYFRKEGILYQVDHLRISSGSMVRPVRPADSTEQLTTDRNVTILSEHASTADCTTSIGHGVFILPDTIYRRVHSTEPSTPVSERPRRSHNQPEQQHNITGTSGSHAHSRGTSNNNGPLNNVNLITGALSTPALLLPTYVDEAVTQEMLSSLIVTACEQLQSRVAQLATCLARTVDPTKGMVDVMDDALAGLDLDPTPVISTRFAFSHVTSSPHTSIDLMPKLTAIATHLASSKPALWVFAFVQLIELFRPNGNPGIETPSPFELHQSGVSAALLKYLTEQDRSEIRLWIVYRMFFGSRACSDDRLLSGMNLIQLGRKQPVTSKNWPHLLPLSPILLETDKADQLREVDRFLAAQLSRSSDEPLITEGPEAFHALIQCLLAWFHRHEHFQVCSVPPLLPVDSKLFQLLHLDPATDECNVKDVSQKTSPPSTPTTNVTIGPMTDKPGDSLSQSSASSTTRFSCNGRDAFEGLRATNDQNKNIFVHATHFAQPVTSQHCAPIAWSKPSSFGPPPAAPQPGFLCIDLVPLPDTHDSDLVGDTSVPPGDDAVFVKSACNRHSSATTTGVFSSSTGRRKETRKSSTGSWASHQTNSSTVTNHSLHSALPGQFSLQISALATLKNLERLLMQRTYVNHLIQDGLWNPDHDYGLNLSSWISGEHESAIREDEFRGLLDVHFLDEDGSPTGEDRDDGDGRAQSRLNHHRRQHENDELDVVVVVEDDEGADTQNEVCDSRSRHEQSRGIRSMHSDGLIGLKRSHLSTTTRSHRRTAVSSNIPTSHIRRSDRSHATRSTEDPIYTVSETAPFTSAPTSNRIVYPSLFSYSIMNNSRGTVETRTPDGTTRGLRTLLQRTPNVAPGPHAKLASEPSLTVPAALRPVDTRGLRRRSVGNAHGQRGIHPREIASSHIDSGLHAHTRSHPENPNYNSEESGHNKSVQDSQPGASGSSHLSKTAKNTQTNATPSTSRSRRLKGSSILAAFGALANLTSANSHTEAGTSNVTSGSVSSSHSTGKFSHSNAASGHTTTRRTSIMNHSHSEHSPHSSIQSSSSSSASSMSPHPSPVSPFGRSDGHSTSIGHVRQLDKHHRYPYTVQFHLGGHRLPANMALFEAVRHYSTEFAARLSVGVANADRVCKTASSSGITSSCSLTEQDVDDMAGHLMWTMTHTIYYRLVYTNIDSSHQASSSTTSRPTGTTAFGHRKSDSHLSQHVTGLASRAFSITRKTSDPCPSSPSNTGSVSIGTCLKRRRPDLDSETNIVGLTVSQCANTINTKVSTCSHPLYSRLSHELPNGFLAEVRCACVPTTSSCGAHCSSMSYPPSSGGSVARPLLDESVSNSLALLRALHSISRLWYTVHDALDPFPIVSPAVFRSPKLAIKAGRQLQDVFSVLAGNLPTWLVHLIAACPFLFPFEVRRTFFYAYHFDRDRTLLRFQDTVASSVTELEQHQHSSVMDPRGAVQPHFPHNLMDGTVQSLHIGAGLGGVSPRSGAGSSANSELSAPTTAFSSALSSPGSTAWMSNVSADSPTPAPGSSLAATTSSSAIPLRPQRLFLQTRGRYATRITLTPSLRRHKVTVHRDGKRLLRQAETTLADLLASRAVLEIAFDGEVGFGLGPTLEFYTLVSRQLMKASLGLWHGNEVTADGYIIAPPPGLYPRPLAKQARSTIVREVRSKFLFLGRLMARALLDGRQLDLPFSPAFFKWFLGDTSNAAVSEGHILPNDLALVDPDLGRHVRQLTELANKRHILQRQLDQAATSGANAHFLFATRIHTSTGSSAKSARSGSVGSCVPSGGGGSTSSAALETRKLDELRAALMILDNEIEDLCLNFVLPGYEIELLKNGNHIQVTGSNLGDYLRLVTHWLVIEGVSRQMEAVLEGFDSVLPNVRSRLAVLFQPDEMEGLFCGRSLSQFELLDRADLGVYGRTHPGGPGWLSGPPILDSEGWDVASLTEACRCDHGYTPQSRTIRHLFEVMSEFNEEERRLFLQFVTGSPRLPVGGFRALKPPLKIVMKRETGDNADNHLPSVMTCQNYLKLPDYSTKELLARKLRYAIREGQNAFHLS